MIVIRKDTTPKGDGNLLAHKGAKGILLGLIRKDTTPKGDGNLKQVKKTKASS